MYLFYFLRLPNTMSGQLYNRKLGFRFFRFHFTDPFS